MTDQRSDGMYECPDCSRTYETEKALVFCCNPDWDKPNFIAPTTRGTSP